MRAARSAALVLGALVTGLTLGADAARAAAPVEQVMLSDPGSGFVLVGDDLDDRGVLNRTFQNDHAVLFMTGFAVTTPPGVRTVFSGLPNLGGLEPQPDPSFDLAAWLVPEGGQPGEGGLAILAFASRDHFFSFRLETDGSFDPIALLRDLAARQIEAAGGPPEPEEQRSPERTEAEAEVVAMLPTNAPEGYGLTLAATMAGDDELEAVDGVQPEVADFLNNNSTTAARAWSDGAGNLITVVSITRFPYEIFAAAAAAEFTKSDRWQILSTDAMADVPDVVGYTGTGDESNQIGTVFRRGDLFVIVLTQHLGDVPPQTAAALTADLTRQVAASHPGDTAPYDFPDAPSKTLGLALTAALVTAVATGSAVIARLRARRVRRGWAGGELPPPDIEHGNRGEAIALDADASRLRRQGGIIAVAQLVTVNIGIVALAGDFAWPGVIVAAIALIAGVALTHWWQRRELSLLGASAPPRELVLPRPAGAAVGLLSLALLGFGIAYLLKGLRYLVLQPSLAQMKWSNWLGVAPRTVGVIFVAGGFVVAMLGGWLYRIARALSRAGTKRTLQADPRPAALWLRSFDDDSLPLPTIASARRPLFELFSLRGADPFEESVAWELNTYGPVVAVGRPGRSLASLGAAREHLSDATWRDQVAARMDDAGIVAIATGETDGLAWELGQIVTGGHVPKTFFVFPPVPPDALGRRWEHTAASLERAGQPVGPLPAPLSWIHTVRLDADGTPNVTFAHRRDEATYRTAVDRTIASRARLEGLPAVASATGAAASRYGA